MYKRTDTKEMTSTEYMSRKEGGRIFVPIRDCVHASIYEFEEYIKKSKERLITVVSDSNGHIRTNSKTTKN